MRLKRGFAFRCLVFVFAVASPLLLFLRVGVVDLHVQMQQEGLVIDNYFEDVRRASRITRTLKVEAVHSALLSVESYNGTSLQYMVTIFMLIIIQANASNKWVPFQYDRFSSRLTQVQNTCDKYNLGKGTSSFPREDSYEVCECFRARMKQR